MFVTRYRALFKFRCLLITTSSLCIIFSIFLIINLLIYIISTDNILGKLRQLICVPYAEPDPRPFFERDYHQLDIPRRKSMKSDADVIRELHSLRLLILATARNVAKQIDKFRNATEAILDLFHPSSRILVCESDSSDETVKKFSAWPRAQLYTFGKLSTIYRQRVKRIAFCRNKLLNVSHEILADYLLMTDVDLFAASIPSIVSNFRYNRNKWAAMTASSGIYYDIWALRTLSDSILNYDVWRRVWQISRENKYCDQTISDQIVGNHQRPIPFQRGLIEVRSAFNGAGLYKANETSGCYYSGADSTCEHVPFHSCIREKNRGRIFINPEFLLN